MEKLEALEATTKTKKFHKKNPKPKGKKRKRSDSDGDQYDKYYAICNTKGRLF